MMTTTFNPLAMPLNNTSTEGLQRFRLTNWDWFQEWYDKLGADEYWAYDNYVWKQIENLRPHSRYNIELIPEDRQELFIKLACEYIIENGGIDESGICFSSDWKYLIRTKPWKNQ